MELLKQTASVVDRLLGHGDAPLSVSLPLAAWGATVATDGLAMVTGQPSFDAASRIAIGVGLVGMAGSMATGALEGRSDGVGIRGHEAVVAGHVAGTLAVGGLFAASLALRIAAHGRGEPPSPLARGLAFAGAGIALANAILTRRLADDEPLGRDRLDPATPLGLHAAMER
jgi:uncharacterized membrane protein